MNCNIGGLPQFSLCIDPNHDFTLSQSVGSGLEHNHAAEGKCVETEIEGWNFLGNGSPQMVGADGKPAFQMCHPNG